MKQLLLVLFTLISFAGCKKDRYAPEAPSIEFGEWKYLKKDAAGHDQLVELIIYFKDRNGDIGRREFEQVDNCGRPVNDLFIYYEKKVNNIYSPAYIPLPDSALDLNCNLIPGSYVDSSQIFFHRALEYIQPEGNNRSIEGEIAYQLDYASALSNLFPVGRCKIYLMDRAGNKSNVIYSDDLVIN